MPRIPPRRPVATVLVLLALSATAPADVVLLRNGSRIEGRIVSESDAAVVVASEGGRVTVSRDQVGSVTRGPVRVPAAPASAAADGGRAVPGAETAPAPAAAATPPASARPAPRPPVDVEKLRRTIAAKLERVGATEAPTREAFAAELQALGPEAVPLLVEALPQLESVDRLLPAVTAIAAAPTPEVLPALARLAEADEAERRHVAAFGLGQCGGASCVPVLGRLLLDPADIVRYSAREALVNLKARHPGPEATRAALRALEEGRGPARRECLLLLAQLDDPAGLDAVEEAAARASGDDRAGLWKALGSMSDPRVVDFFRRRLREEDAPGRRLAVEAVAFHRRATVVIPLLIERLDDEAPVRAAALQHLVRVSGQDLGPDAVAWQAWWREERQAVEERERMRAP